MRYLQHFGRSALQGAGVALGCLGILVLAAMGVAAVTVLTLIATL